MAVYHAAEHGHKPGAAGFEHKCPASQGQDPVFSLPAESVPHISPETGGPVGFGASAQTVSKQAVEKVAMPRRTVSLDDDTAVPTKSAAMFGEVVERVGTSVHDESLDKNSATGEMNPTSGDRLRRGAGYSVPIAFDEGSGK